MINVTIDTCGKCKYSSFEHINKSLIKVYCDLREKTYIYGQCVQCDGVTKDMRKELDDE